MERMLGDIYLGTALSHIAETHYLRALQLSESAKDIEGQALAQNALGLIYEAAGNKPDAVLRFQNALELYGKVGDAPRIKEIEEQLKKLK
jgi:tetratricopeptide (TPR) repeat protein